MYIPDLFGAYTKGRELAIEKNWQDLKNYEQVENMRNTNDLQALEILAGRADFGANRSMVQNQADSSNAAWEVMNTLQPGRVARADMLSRDAANRRNTYVRNEPTYREVLDAIVKAGLGKQGVNASIQTAANQSWTPQRQQAAGQAIGNTGYNTTIANGVASTDFVPAAQRGIAQNQLNHDTNMAAGRYQLGEINNNIKQQPLMHQLGEVQLNNDIQTQQGLLDNQQATAEAMQKAAVENKFREYVSYLQVGDAPSLLAAQRLATEYGFPMLGQTTQAAPTQAVAPAPTVQPTQGVPPMLQPPSAVPAPQHVFTIPAPFSATMGSPTQTNVVDANTLATIIQAYMRQNGANQGGGQ